MTYYKSNLKQVKVYKKKPKKRYINKRLEYNLKKLMKMLNNGELVGPVEPIAEGIEYDLMQMNMLY